MSEFPGWVRSGIIPADLQAALDHYQLLNPITAVVAFIHSLDTYFVLVSSDEPPIYLLYQICIQSLEPTSLVELFQFTTERLTLFKQALTLAVLDHQTWQNEIANHELSNEDEEVDD